MAINYVKGDATKPQSDTQKTKIIAHIVNTGNNFNNGRGHVGVWGGGFTGSLDKRWEIPGASYRSLVRHFRDYPEALLGTVQVIKVQYPADDTEGAIFIANMFGQVYGWQGSLPPIRYGALGAALARLGMIAADLNAEIHMPRIGTALAGGSWDKVEPLIERYLASAPVFVYDYEPEPEIEEEEDEYEEDEDEWDDDLDEEDEYDEYFDDDDDEDEEDEFDAEADADAEAMVNAAQQFSRAVITRGF